MEWKRRAIHRLVDDCSCPLAGSTIREQITKSKASEWGNFTTAATGKGKISLEPVTIGHFLFLSPLLPVASYGLGIVDQFFLKTAPSTAASTAARTVIWVYISTNRAKYTFFLPRSLFLCLSFHWSMCGEEKRSEKTRDWERKGERKWRGSKGEDESKGL